VHGLGNKCSAINLPVIAALGEQIFSLLDRHRGCCVLLIVVAVVGRYALAARLRHARQPARSGYSAVPITVTVSRVSLSRPGLTASAATGVEPVVTVIRAGTAARILTRVTIPPTRTAAVIV